MRELIDTLLAAKQPLTLYVRPSVIPSDITVSLLCANIALGALVPYQTAFRVWRNAVEMRDSVETLGTGLQSLKAKDRKRHEPVTPTILYTLTLRHSINARWCAAQRLGVL